MARYWAVALLALVPTSAAPAQAGKGDKVIFRVQGKISQDDPADTKRRTPCKVHLVNLRAGKVYQIDMVKRTAGLDPYLRLEDVRGKQLDEDDDSGGNLNARIMFNCTKNGQYKVIATTFAPQMAGQYIVIVREAGRAQTTAAGHGALLGKPAPDFKGDFAVGGQALKLSDLKGKVVLVQFWEVRSAACAAAFPRLRALSQAHKDAGLEVVGVTYYHSELGHKLGFDKASGKVTAVSKAGKEDDRALLKDFAAHHKLNYELLVLPKADALKAFDAYAVNGIPQFVLIDRAGVVRQISVGDGGAAALEGEITKLLAKK
jgi:peroxiredoxin